MFLMNNLLPLEAGRICFKDRMKVYLFAVKKKQSFSLYNLIFQKDIFHFVIEI